jgi:hypothetical protein
MVFAIECKLVLGGQLLNLAAKKAEHVCQLD